MCRHFYDGSLTMSNVQVTIFFRVDEILKICHNIWFDLVGTFEALPNKTQGWAFQGREAEGQASIWSKQFAFPNTICAMSL